MPTHNTSRTIALTIAYAAILYLAHLSGATDSIALQTCAWAVAFLGAFGLLCRSILLEDEGDMYRTFGPRQMIDWSRVRSEEIQSEITRTERRWPIGQIDWTTLSTERLHDDDPPANDTLVEGAPQCASVGTIRATQALQTRRW